MGATSQDVHVDAVLSEMAIGYRPEGYIADMIFPTVSVSKQSDKYVVWSREDRLRIHDTKRAPATEAKRIVENVSSGQYFAQNHALASSVPIEDFKNADPIYLDNLNTGKVELILDGLMLAEEVRVANMVTSGSNVGSFTAVASAWNDNAAGSDPIGDVNTGIDNVQYSTGKRPNRLTFGLKAWQTFRRHSDVTNIIFGANNGGGYPSREQVANLFEVEEVLVGGTFQNTAGEGLPEDLSSIWDDHLLIHFTPFSTTKERPSFGYRFRWVQPGLPNMQVERHPYDTKKKAQDIEVGYYQDEVITGDEYSYLITNVTSST